jgi:transposase
MSTADGGVPLFLRVADGNEADQAVFAELLTEFRARMDLDALFVADAALYGAGNLASLGRLRWLCRVPASVKEARRALAQTPRRAFVQSERHEGHRIAQIESDYGGISQRWLLVHSEQLEKVAGQRLERRLLRQEKGLNRELSRMGRSRFACRQDAAEAAEAFAAEHLDNHHRLSSTRIIEVAHYGKRGRPAKGTEPEEIRYRIKTELQRDGAAIKEELERSGRYILATNVLDSQQLSNDDLLAEYKSRQSVERGFRFLKDPLFFTASTFVKTPRRVAAIAMVMGLCLLVYALGERSLRQALARAGEGIRHQTGKPTRRPTLRWVFQLFQAVHLLSVDGRKQISNLTEERRSILGFLGHGCRRYYLLS